MALTADSTQLYIPLETIYGKPDGQGNYLMQALDIKRINDNLWNIVKKIQGNLTLADLTDLAVQTLTAVTVITQNLYATYGDVAELTVDRLETANKVDMYWASDTSDINYISIQGQYIKFITGTTTGSTTQHTDRNGNNLYYNSEATALNYKTVGMTTTTTAYPVTVYSYTSATKMELSFALVGDDYEVDWILGAGTGTGDYGKVKIHKDTTGVNFSYFNGSTGAEKKIRIDDDNIAVSGNTGAGLNLRNIAIDTTAPSSPQNGDLWVDSDYSASAGTAYFHKDNGGYQKWSSYADSPGLSADYPYQAIVRFTTGPNVGRITLCMSDTPFYYNTTDPYKMDNTSTNFQTSIYSAGVWGSLVPTEYLTTTYFVIEECNSDVYTDSTYATVYKAKTTTAVQDAGTVWVPIVSTPTASDVTYDNTTSGLSASDVQAAIDELASASGAVSSVNGATGAIILDGGDILLTGYAIAGAASAVAATDTVNEAFGKLQKTVDGIETLLAGI